MKMRTKQFIIVLVIAALAVAIYSGSVFAQTSTPVTPTPTNMLQWMQERLGPEAWAQRVERMTKIHGAEFVSQMMAHMAQQTSCPCTDGQGAGFGMQQGMMGRGMMRQGTMPQQPNGTPQGMMGKGMMRQGGMGRGMQEQGRSWGFPQSMGPRFWNNRPDTTATPAQ